ncbi:phosphonate C-P lyase system protein PhnH [Pseudonocardia sp. HH130630-07]|uniref:phosphonate C-P lyase system protein PhnH n=1 Tax=Pseudonocardia sp. HH130630-07 TaxID=1690815 RepID=UPI000814F182|nr:phosphonate C-P lyase system protein PhnH [Pseudonocardia sp. HH130630-07]ANY10553.1 phosphonate C-P lyase system protein PhnH [Pseudonocardia sp. HH130630-07]
MTGGAGTVPGPGFGDPAQDAQRVFRAVLDALARPGRAQPVGALPSPPPPALGNGVTAVALTLFDEDSAVWCAPGLAADPAVMSFLTFHTGMRTALAPAVADFVIAAPDTLPALEEMAPGTDEEPHRSTTVLLDVRGAGIAASPARWAVRGPGIDGMTTVELPWLPAGFVDQWRTNGGLFPRGVDLLVIDDDSVLGLPRTTRLHASTDPQPEG